MLNFRSNVVVNYVAQFYSAVAVLVVVPKYIDVMGAEGFGLIGFFIMLQAWAQILDAGMSGSVTRLIATSRLDGKIFTVAMSQFSKILYLFAIISLFIMILGFLSKDHIATSWLSSSVDESIITVSIFAIFLSISFKYLSGPFRSALVGLERHGTISIVTILVISFKFPLSLVYLSYCSSVIDQFFIYQVFISFFEMTLYGVLFLIFRKKELHVLSAVTSAKNGPMMDLSFRNFLKMSGLLSLLSVCWIVVTQIDKLMLSKYLSLEGYGNYSVAVTLSGALLLLAAPLNQILLPMMTGLVAKHEFKKFQEVFYFSFVAVTVFSLSLAFFLSFFGSETLYVWTGKEHVAQESNRYLGLLALGNAISVCMNLVFIVLFALGDLSKHTKIYFLYSLVLVPITITVANNFGGLGASILWLLHNFIFFCCWGLVVIKRVFPGSVLFLISKLLVPLISVSLLHYWIVSFYLPEVPSRFILSLLLFAVGVSNVFLCLSYVYFGNMVQSIRKLPWTNFKAQN